MYPLSPPTSAHRWMMYRCWLRFHYDSSGFNSDDYPADIYSISLTAFLLYLPHSLMIVTFSYFIYIAYVSGIKMFKQLCPTRRFGFIRSRLHIICTMNHLLRYQVRTPCHYVCFGSITLNYKYSTTNIPYFTLYPVTFPVKSLQSSQPLSTMNAATVDSVVLTGLLSVKNELLLNQLGLEH